jgi:hypothetical protein
MPKSLVITSVALGFFVLGGDGLPLIQHGAIMAQQRQSQGHAPEFPLGLLRLNTDQPLTIAGLRDMDGEAINLPLQIIRAGTEGRLVINFELPTGYKLNPAAPMSYAVYVHGAGIQVPNSGRPLSAHAIEFPLTLSFQTSPGSHRAELDVEATFYWCREDNTGVCMIQSARWHVPLETSETVENRVLTVSTTAQLLDQAGPAFSPPAPLDFKGDGSR